MAKKDQLRLREHPVLEIPADRRELSFTFNGQRLVGLEGETIAAALWANGYRVFRTKTDGSPRSLYCGVGHCYECRVTVNGVPNIRACVTLLEKGMEIVEESQQS